MFICKKKLIYAHINPFPFNPKLHNFLRMEMFLVKWFRLVYFWNKLTADNGDSRPYYSKDAET